MCSNNLKKIDSALSNYHDHYGCLPPPCIYDKTGRPAHSWRVLILPFLEYGGLYKRYDFNEPWDGPNNKRLLAERPDEYRCLSDPSTCAKGSTTTSYVAVIGSEAFWQRDKDTSLEAPALQGNLRHSVMLIETANSGIQWTEPKDLCLDDLQGTRAESAVIVQSPHMRDQGYFFYETPTGVNVGVANGRVDFLFSCALSTEKVKRLLTVGAYRDEDIDYSWDKEELQPNWPHCIGLPVWIVSVGLLLYRAVRDRRRAE